MRLFRDPPVARLEGLWVGVLVVAHRIDAEVALDLHPPQHADEGLTRDVDSVATNALVQEGLANGLTRRPEVTADGLFDLSAACVVQGLIVAPGG